MNNWSNLDKKKIVAKKATTAKARINSNVDWSVQVVTSPNERRTQSVQIAYGKRTVKYKHNKNAE